jgi:hypothetical protein
VICFHGSEIEVVFWVAVPHSSVVEDQHFRCHVASIFRVEVHAQGDGSTAMLPSHTGSQHVI